ETLGGVRIIKAYATERREDRVFTRGAHRLFRNVASTITGTSAVGAFGTIVVGSIVVLVILVSGRAISAGTMTVGDLVSYLVFTGLMAAPIIQIAAIGTQRSEAFAGLDRIRELMQMTTEGDEDRDRDPLEPIEGEVEFEGVSFEYTPGVPVLRDVSFVAPA